MPSLTRFSRGEILTVCREQVYPPCKKLAASIALNDCLAADLGYVGSSATMLATRTNDAFQLTPPDHFNSMDLCAFETVKDHIYAIVHRLALSGRLMDDLDLR
jgi:hypothetical protein